MRIGPVAESLRERLALLFRLGPRPLLETHSTLLLAQTLMVAAKVGLVEALEATPRSPGEIASHCGTDERATRKLLGVLAASGYVRALPDGSYALSAEARRWLLAAGEASLRDSLLFRFVEWDWIGGLERFVRSGTPLDIHARMSSGEWDLYQSGMRSLAGVLAREVAWRTPMPKGARTMLDVGGSHGVYSSALCRRHPRLSAEILDLPEAVERAASESEPGGRVRHRTGDALVEELGSETFDLVFISNLLHHFEPEQSRDLIRRAARALRPGGILVVQELFAPDSAREVDQVSSLTDLYFALTSAAGTLAARELAAWEREAGLAPMRPLRFVLFPGAGQQSAKKPR